MTHSATRIAAALLAGAAFSAGAQDHKPAPVERISYDRMIRPILQANCHGCHQPAKAKGAYVMTSHERMLAAGESNKKAIVSGKPEASYFVETITPNAKGEAEMPKGRKPLTPAEVDLIRRWIAEGAADDTPINAKVRYDAEHPPVYTRPPVVASIDYSPDGQVLAVAGFHEVLLMKGDGSERLARLVGVSERVQSVKFSPDGKQLAVAAGLPSRSGEVQVWDVEKRQLLLSVATTYDTVYGVSWSPDGKKIAYGCADKSVRAIDAKTGDPVLYQGAHDDWVLDTVFSADGSHVVSVGRDMTVKLTEVATQRFVDNVTSITPGALKGGIAAVARHPKRDEIVLGGSDGQPKVYRIHRLVGRVIGDDSNLIRELPAMRGRVWSVDVSPDGKRIVAGSGLDGRGEVAVYSYEFDTSLPDGIKAIMGKVSTSRSQQERETLEKYHKAGVKQIAKADVEKAIVYSVAFRPDGQAFAAAGSDGVVRVYETETGKLAGQFSPAPIDAIAAALVPFPGGIRRALEAVAADTLPSGLRVAALEVQPEALKLAGPFDYAQLVVTAKLESGEAIDATRMAELKLSADVAWVSRGGLVEPKADGQAALQVTLAGKTVSVPVSVHSLAAEPRADYVRDVNPVVSRLGCNAGTCHGSAKGRNGFKLSLRGYDAIHDVRALTDDLSSRRMTVASPDDSLMLLKSTGAVPHEGGRLLQPGDVPYRILRSWIAHGASLDLATPKVAKIDLLPQNPVVEKLGARQQFRVVATYADGRLRDVTREAYVESGNTEVATYEKGAILTSVRRGEAPVLARYEGAYAATTLTVMGDRAGFAWEDPPAWGRIDELVAAKWKRMKIRPSELAGDAEFLRRVTLDLTGLPPTVDEVRAFLADARETRQKREALIDKLIGSEAFVEHWSNKWADLLQVNRKFLGSEGATALRKWIREEVSKNTPYDEFARKIVVADGSNKDNPAASYYKILRDPGTLTENTTHLFLAVRFNCTKCHDHPFEKWTQDQYYETAAWFARVGLKADPQGGGKNIGGTAVEGAKPLYEIVYERPDGEVTHERTGTSTPPRFPYPVKYDAAKNSSRRQELALWLTSPDNAYFARSFANRLWGYLFGVGIIDPVDDIRAGNPASNPQLLDHLTEEFVKGGFDVRKALRAIAASRTYQLAVATNRWNEDDRINFSHALARRLPAEVLYDAVHAATGSVSRIPGVAPGTRAAAIPDSGIDLPSGFLATFGRPARESACECERTNELRLGSVMSLISGPTIADAIADPQNEIARLVAREKDDAKLVDEVFLRLLGRPARPKEVETALALLKDVDADHEKLGAALAAREAEWKELLPRLEQRRMEEIAKAKADLEDWQKELAPVLAQREKEKAEKTAALEAAYKKYEAEVLPGRIADWEKKQKATGDWTPLVARKLEASNSAKLVQNADLSVSASGRNGKGAYTFVAHTELRGITAVRLEVIADPKLPNGSGGRAADGNFVLTQFELSAAPRKEGGQPVKVAFVNPKADFSQANFDVKFAVDGTPNNGRGWAISPSYGVTHWAVFDAKDPVGFEGGTVLTFSIRQTFDAPDFMLGRFRISVTTVPAPGLTLSDELRSVLAVDPAARDEAQREALLKYYKAVDAEGQKKAAELAESRKPLPVDPKLKELQDGLASVSRPLQTDPKLVQLRADAQASTAQVQNKRLTMAQDLAWALINSPAFLFNR
jgi:WD40 repeat protein